MIVIISITFPGNIMIKYMVTVMYELQYIYIVYFEKLNSKIT